MKESTSTLTLGEIFNQVERTTPAERKNVAEKLAYYKKVEQDPLFNRKEYVKKRLLPDWEAKRVLRNRELEWKKVINLCRTIKDDSFLLEELQKTWRLNRRMTIRTAEEPTTLSPKLKQTLVKREAEIFKPKLHNQKRYLPRIKNSRLTPEQVRELTGVVVSQGLDVEYDLVQTVVEYMGDLLDLQDKRQEKKVELYTKQKKEGNA